MHMTHTLMLSIACAGSFCSLAIADLVSISFPESVALSQSTTLDGPRSVDAPFDYSGIGNIINPDFAAPGSGSNPNDFALHQTVGTVDLTDVVVTFEYDEEVLVESFEVIQHHNGVRSFEVLVGNSLDMMTSIGTASMPENTTEYASFLFEYDTMLTGKFVQLRVVEPELADQGGWAFYRAIPNVIPTPGTTMMLGFGLAAAARRRR